MAAAPTRNLAIDESKIASLSLIAADQETTHNWWSNERERFRIYSSIFIIEEASGTLSSESKPKAAMDPLASSQHSLTC
jgi:hypothetical protein